MARLQGRWRRLVNTAAGQGGSIHDDRQARELGFRGALVPGGVVASATMPLILERFAAPWMEGGWFTFTFMSGFRLSGGPGIWARHQVAVRAPLRYHTAYRFLQHARPAPRKVPEAGDVIDGQVGQGARASARAGG